MSRLVFFSLFVTACVDQPVAIPSRATGAPAHRLSELGLFAGDLAAQQPNPGVIPYEVIAPLYSDGASKHRFVWPPADKTLEYQDDRWVLPPGTIIAKTFYFPADARDSSSPMRLIETRILLITGTDIKKATYLWNDSQTEAVSSGGNVDVPVRYVDKNGVLHSQVHHVPGTDQCGMCHGEGGSSHALGLRTRQMNLGADYSDGTNNQIDHLFALGVLDRAPPGPRKSLVDPMGNAPLDARAKSYFDANCSSCHVPGGFAGTTLYWDYDSVDSAICRKTRSVDGHDRVIVPGNAAASEFVARMVSSDPFVHMPLGPSHIPDADGIAVLSQWTDSLLPPGCPK